MTKYTLLINNLEKQIKLLKVVNETIKDYTQYKSIAYIIWSLEVNLDYIKLLEERD